MREIVFVGAFVVLLVAGLITATFVSEGIGYGVALVALLGTAITYYRLTS